MTLQRRGGPALAKHALPDHAAPRSARSERGRARLRRSLSYGVVSFVLCTAMFLALSWGFNNSDLVEEPVATFDPEPEPELDASPTPTSQPTPTVAATSAPSNEPPPAADSETIANTGADPDRAGIDYFVPNYVGVADEVAVEVVVSAPLPAATPAPPPPVPTTQPVPAPTNPPAEQPTPTRTPHPQLEEPPPDPAADPTPADSGGGPTEAQWAALRNCESGGDYTILNPNGLYRGAYQFSVATWNWVAGQFRSDLVGVDPAAAAPADQDAMALALYSLNGASPWPTCGRYLL